MPKEMEDEYYASEEQGIEQEPQDKELAMDTGDKDEDVYSEEGRDKLVEEDEISPEEEGFMQGEEAATKYD